MPDTHRHLERAQLAEHLGYNALWLRDVPFNVDTFGDAGQIWDPLTYLGYLTAATTHITLGVASIALTLRHPAHVTKAATTTDVLSNGRLILGLASGDRPDEFPALGLPFAARGEDFRSKFEYLRNVMQPRASFASPHGTPQAHMDLLPKPTATTLPLLVTGASRQDRPWIARNADGWMTYPRFDLAQQQRVVGQWHQDVVDSGQSVKPLMQPLYLDLVDETDCPATPIHLGFRCGANTPIKYLERLQTMEVNHDALNLRFQSGDLETAMERIAHQVLPQFTHTQPGSR